MSKGEIIFWCGAALISFGATVVFYYAVVHFIIKYW